MVAKDPALRSQISLLANDTGWAKTPVRSERTAQARKASPVSYDYWLAKTTADGIVCEADIPKAAENAHRAYMRQLSLKAAASRRKKRGAREQKSA